MEYVDLYLVHWPMAIKPSKPYFPLKREDIVPMDLSGVWQAMEECHRLGLAKMIGVSNFTTKKLQELLAVAKIPPAVNQVCVDWINIQLGDSYSPTAVLSSFTPSVITYCQCSGSAG